MPNVRPIIRPLARDISRSIVHGSAFNPLSLFANGEQGAWYDPSDLTTLYQDSGATTPVTSDGDPVGLMLDKSGNGSHATQSVSADRPMYRTDGTLHWISTNGVNQFFDYGISGFAGFPVFWQVFGIRSTANSAVLFSALNDPVPWASIWQDGSASAPQPSLDVFFQDLWVDGSLTSVATRDDAHTLLADGSGHVSTFHYTTNETSPASGGMGIGKYNGTSFHVLDFYGGVIVNELDTAERESTERYVATRTGVTL